MMEMWDGMNGLSRMLTGLLESHQHLLLDY